MEEKINHALSFLEMHNLHKDLSISSNFIFICKEFDKLDVSLIEYCLEKKLDLNLVDDKSMDCLHHYCTNKNISLQVIEFLSKNVRVKNTERGKNYLHHVCLNPLATVEIVKELLKINDPNKKENYFQQNALHYYCINENLNFKVLTTLFDRCDDINEKSGEGKTYFHYICENKKINFDLVKFFVEKKTDLNLMHNRENVLHMALKNENTTLEMIKFLAEKEDFFQHQKKLKLKFPKSYFLNFCQHSNCDIEIFKFLIEKGAQMDQKDDFSGDTALQIFCKKENLNLEILKLFLIENISLDYLNHEKKNLLHLICENKTSTNEIFDFFTSKIDPNNLKNFLHHQDNKKENCFYYFCKSPFFNEISLKFFLENKIDLFAREKKPKKSLLFNAIKNEKVTLDCIKLFLHSKIDVKQCYDKNFSLLHYYCKNKIFKKEIFDFLIEKNLNVNEKSKNNLGPLQMATFSKTLNPEMIKYLLENKANATVLNENLNDLYKMLSNKNYDLDLIKFMLEKNVNPYRAKIFTEIANTNRFDLLSIILSHSVPANSSFIVSNSAKFKSEKCRQIITCLIDEKSIWTPSLHQYFPSLCKKKKNSFSIFYFYIY